MSTIKNIVKWGLFAAVVYGAYKVGQSSGKKNNIDSQPNPQTTPEPQVFEYDSNSEEDYIIDLIRELKNKPNKTQKDRYNIELLQIKLNQILGKK
jgi:hypothetical protein